MEEGIEGHITIIAGFGTLRTQASIRFATQPAKSHRGLSGPPWRSVSKDTLTEWSAVAECIEGHPLCSCE